MITVGLTGGIGSGKSTVARLLADRGAVVIDTDQIARDVVQPGEPAYNAIHERFGDDVLLSDSTIDRQALAGVVFADSKALADLEAIVHPEVHAFVAACLVKEAQTDHIVVLEVPLLVNADGSLRYETAGVIVVDTPPDIALERLVALRRMDEHDARARIAAQIPAEVRLRAADFIIVNTGTLVELEEMTIRAWQWIERLFTTSTH